MIYGVYLNDFLRSGVGEYDGSVRLPDFIRARMRIGPVAELLMPNALIRLAKVQITSMTYCTKSLNTGMTVLRTDGYYRRFNFSGVSSLRASSGKGTRARKPMPYGH